MVLAAQCTSMSLASGLPVLPKPSVNFALKAVSLPRLPETEVKRSRRFTRCGGCDRVQLGPQLYSKCLSSVLYKTKTAGNDEILEAGLVVRKIVCMQLGCSLRAHPSTYIRRRWHPALHLHPGWHRAAEPQVQSVHLKAHTCRQPVDKCAL